MNVLRRKAKFLGILVVLGFIFAALELHADHEGHASQQEHHCGIQCCTSHNLAPQKECAAVLGDSNEVQFMLDTSLTMTLLLFPESIFRPPIPLA